MALTDYGKVFQTYPVYSADNAFEGAFKRFTSMPTPTDVFEYTMMGLPKIFPLTKEPIRADHIEPFLSSALTEIEMSMGMNLSPVEHWESFDYVDGAFTANYMGLRLSRWPATEIKYMKMKFPHSNLQPAIQEYSIPSTWICLRKNRVNVVASYGTVSVSTSTQNLVNAGGLFAFLSGFSTSSYRPAMIEINYVAGWDSDKLPCDIAELIKVWAGQNFLATIMAQLFPVSGVDVAIDGVRQGASMPVISALQGRIQWMEQRKAQLQAAIKKGLGRQIPVSFVGV